MDDVQGAGAGPSVLDALWRFKYLVAAAGLVAAVSGFVFSARQPPVFEAQSRLLLADPTGAGLFGEPSIVGGSTRFVRNKAEFAQSTSVLARASELLGGSVSVSALQTDITVEASDEVDLLTVRATASSAQQAVEVADAVGEAYQELEGRGVQESAREAVAELTQSSEELQGQLSEFEQQLAADPGNVGLQSQRDAVVAQRFTLQTRIDQVSTDAALFGSGVELFEPAEEPTSPVAPVPLRDALLALVIALMGSGSVAWWRATATQKADRRQDPARVLGVPLLGEVPDFAGAGMADSTPALSAPTSAAGEAYQFLVAALEHALARANGSTFVVSSADPGDGKTVTALNLAVAAARDGRSVALVDADERARGLTRRTEVSHDTGLVDLADDDVPFERCASTARLADQVVLTFVPAGSPLDDAAAFFRTPGFRKAMLRVKERAELVIVDSPPLLAVSDTSAIASQCDGIVLVVRRGTRLRELEDVVDRLRFVGTPLLGYVYNRAASGRGRYRYYGYRSGTDPSGTGDPGAPASKAPRRLGAKGRRHRSSTTDGVAGASASVRPPSLVPHSASGRPSVDGAAAAPRLKGRAGRSKR